MRTRGEPSGEAGTEITVLVPPEAAAERPGALGSPAMNSISAGSTGGETERALDSLLVLEAVARHGVAGGGQVGGKVQGRVRLGTLIVDTGLDATALGDILEALGQGGLVEGGAYGRCFGLTPSGWKALEDLGIGAASIAELHRDPLGSAS